MRFAAYCRVSSDKQKVDKTIESQLLRISNFASEHDFDVVEYFVDEGVSGSVLNRPGLDALRDLVASRSIQVVLVTSPDRLARSIVLQSLVLEECDRAGVRIHFIDHDISDSPEGRMMVGIHGLFSEYEKAKFSERARRGKLYWARQGAITSGAVPYGYLQVKRADSPTGRSYLRVHPRESKVVRQIFQWYAACRLSLHEIARRLTVSRIRTRRGREVWDAQTIKGILAQTAHKGTLYANKWLMVEPHWDRISLNVPSRARKPTAQPRPPGDWIPIKVPPIVEESLWDAARCRLYEKKRRSPKRYPLRGRFWLTGLLKCEVCGAPYRCVENQPYRYYVCKNRIRPKHAGKRCSGVFVNADEVEKALWQEIRATLSNPEAVVRIYSDTIAEQKPNGPDLQVRSAAVLTRIETLKQLLESGLEDLNYQQRNTLIRLLVTGASLSHRVMHLNSVIPLGPVVFKANARKGQVTRSLTYREMEVLRGIRDGVSFTNLARRLDTSEKSLQVCMNRAKRKLGLPDVETLAKEAWSGVDLETGVIQRRRPPQSRRRREPSV